METYMVQVQVAAQFEDLYIVAASPEAAIEEAKRITTLDKRWAAYVL